MLMTKKYFKDQYDDEEFLLMFRRHPVVMRKHLIFFCVALLVGSLPSLVNPDMMVFFVGLSLGGGIGILVLFYGWIGWYYSVFLVTNQRFIEIKQKGLFNKSVVDIALDQIQMVNYQIKGMQETLLGFGTLSVQTMVGELVISEIHKPAKVQKELSRVIRTHVNGVEE